MFEPNFLVLGYITGSEALASPIYGTEVPFPNIRSISANKELIFRISEVI